ncbi:MAG: linked oxidase protein [Candidatus Nomurabacteria bacterium]|nr:linked oxidase protein [Candidatus Nomurabacteria bacterium]
MLTVSNLLSNVPPLFGDLAKILSGEIVFSHQAFLEASLDGSPYEVMPQTIIYPKTTTDIKHAIAFSREFKIPITVRGGGTSQTGGALGEGIIIDLTRHFNRIRNVNMMDHTVTVDAGTSITTLQEKLKGWNMEIPSLGVDSNKSTIGGLVATKSATSASFYAGTIREWIEGVTIIVDTGEEHIIKDGITPSGRLLGIYQSVFPLLIDSSPILRAAKPEQPDDATGYSIWNTSIGPRQLLDQIVGSDGTLGIITSVTFRVSPSKLFSITNAIQIKDPELISMFVDVAVHHNAERIFLLDQTLVTLTQKFHPDLLPSLKKAQFTLLVTHRDDDVKKVKNKATMFIKGLKVEEDEHVEFDETLVNTITNSDFAYSLIHNYGRGAHKVITSAGGMIVSLPQYASLIKNIDEYMGSKGKLYALSGYAGSGHLSLLSLFDPGTKHFEEEILNYNEEIFKIVKKHKGGISAVGGDGLARTPYLESFYNEATREIFKKLKEAWDPLSIFNPSKKVGGSTNYLRTHISRR